MKIDHMRAAVTLTLGTALTGVATAPAAAADALHHVYRTDGDGVWLHSVPAVQDGLITVLPEGADFSVSCWTAGDVVNGNSVWLYGTSGGYTGYVTDYYVDTHWNSTQDLSDQGIPTCGLRAATPIPSPNADTQAAGVNIQLQANAGHREHVVADLSDDLAAAAAAANVNGQTLARVIYHEGGNYFSWRQDFTKAQEYTGLRGSVGIGQIKPATARDVARQVYGDEQTANLSDKQLRYKLIEDWPFSMRIAAGYIRLQQDVAGIEGEWPQFMAYSLKPETAKAWRETGHAMDADTLKSLGIEVEDFQHRQQKFNDARNAIG
ncbi:hypothetical protein [Kineococcus glutinatus]|uniref:SH3 domain-containing protein n=1 Tax=Kineococcus glutinatus TaxID=1070872 RepID=A0ABP9HFG4_9ACTN